jgi:hypothetical protein
MPGLWLAVEVLLLRLRLSAVLAEAEDGLEVADFAGEWNRNGVGGRGAGPTSLACSSRSTFKAAAAAALLKAAKLAARGGL